MISLRSIEKVYRSSATQTRALNGVSLEIRQGEALAILGPSGSGKTTLLDILGTLSRPSSGEYLLLGQNTLRMSSRELAGLRNAHFGFIFQTFNLLPDWSVEENVRLPLVYHRSDKKISEDRVFQVLKETRMEHKRKSHGNELSGGEQQRAAIARALVLDPEILLADEPTGNLDSGNGHHIMELLLGLWKKGKTLIMITHNEEMARHFPRVIRILDGQIVYDGAYSLPQGTI